MMKALYMLLTVGYLFTGCGSQSGKGDGARLPESSRNPNEDGDTGHEGYYPGILGSDGKNIPITLLPSVIEDGKFIAVCKPGQTFHLDECFDKLHVSDRTGFRVSRAGTTVAETGIMSASWLASFSDIERHGTGRVMRHRQTFQCEDWCAEQPTLYGSYASRGRVEAEETDAGLRLGANTTLFTFFTFGGSPGKPVHAWLANGSITLNGKTLPLPVSRRNVRAALPDFHDDRAQMDSGSELTFKWEDDTYGLGDVPANDDDRRLISITFEKTGDEANVQPDTN